MCRLVAYRGATMTAAHLIFDGEHSLFEQSRAPRELRRGTVNADGYGVVWYADDRLGRIAEARPVWYDPDLRATLEVIRSGCVLAALRDATPGAALDRSALLPLVFERWSFVLDGFVPDFRASHMRALRGRLPDELYAALRGASDAETLFLLAVAELRAGRSPVEALTETARVVLDRVGKDGETQLNMVLSDGEVVAAIRSGSVLETNSLYLARRPPFAPDGFVLASERLDPGAAWEAVDGHSFVEIGADLEVRAEGLFF